MIDELTQVVFLFCRESAWRRKSWPAPRWIARQRKGTTSSGEWLTGSSLQECKGPEPWPLMGESCDAFTIYSKNVIFNQMSVFLMSCALFKVSLLLTHLGWVVLKFEYSTILPNCLTFLPNFTQLAGKRGFVPIQITMWIWSRTPTNINKMLMLWKSDGSFSTFGYPTARTRSSRNLT